MRITNKMIDRQLRTRGKIINILVRKSAEEKFVKSMHTNKKMMSRTKGKNIEGLTCTEEWISRANDGSKLRIRMYKPLHPKSHVPGVLWIHGGGYAMGNPEMSAVTYKRLIAESDCVIVAPDYRLSIEAPYPAALQDCYDALLWMKEHAKELGIRDDQLMVGGESAGGGLTAALTLYARDMAEVQIAFQMPLYPMIDDRMITESSIDNNAPAWDSNSNRWAWKLYLGDLYEKDVPGYAAPARAKDYSNLPPTVTFVGDLEPFRDETIQYVENLRQAGVPVDFEMYEGCYHGFDIICPKAEVSKRAISFFVSSFKYAVDHYFAEQRH
ncbi:alpha/beta hydrolase [Alicyclobacillus dauci]|uniref:Alpha/beta hydrolase n=1 Tax=Alicyclobacillus dauci TaxID=1475485 RepID=A0ABY6Z5E0_9BACL|nr:alpha/beta hydrolase [Alicyclobacillus dauci]WAH38027.1 alpha/beta hydrolase [Alicyclobacillus dauci]